MPQRTVFVTVGTTEFSGLIKAVDGEHLHAELLKQGFSRLIVQYGRGAYRPSRGKGLEHSSSLVVESYDFKPTLDDDLDAADLIISHAGAGSILETLRRKKQLIVVVNDQLMDNHQLELAEELADRKYLLYAENPSGLCGVLAGYSSHAGNLVKYPVPDATPFHALITQEVGVNPVSWRVS